MNYTQTEYLASYDFSKEKFYCQKNHEMQIVIPSSELDLKGLIKTKSEDENITLDLKTDFKLINEINPN